MTATATAPSAAAIAALARGEIVVLLDDDGVGHLVRDARGTSAEDVVAMVRDGGIFSLVLSAARAGELRLTDQSPSSKPARTPARLSSIQGQAYEGDGARRRIAVSVDAREGTTTGISAAERANTVRVAADPATRSADLVVPGHVPPLIAADAGVFAARGAAEAALDLVRLAGGSGAAVTCAMLDAEGAAATPAGVREAAAARGLALVTITAVAARRIVAESPLRAVGRERVITQQGAFTAVSFDHEVTGEAHAALIRGAVAGRAEVPLAVRSSSPVQDLITALAPTGESSLVAVLRRFARAEAGVLIHLRDAGSEDPRALDLVAAALLELGPASVLPLDPALAEPLRERGIEVATPRSAPRRPEGCRDFDYEVDTAL